MAAEPESHGRNHQPGKQHLVPDRAASDVFPHPPVVRLGPLREGAAAEAGAQLSTHLGNGCAQMLDRVADTEIVLMPNGKVIRTAGGSASGS